MNRNTILSVLAIPLAMLLLLAAPVAVEAQWTYTTGDGAVTITGYTGPWGAAMAIPASINGLPVTCIGEGAFSNCLSLSSLTIANSVTSIGDYAFYGCENLTSITIPGSVTNFGLEAFYYCRGLTNVTICNGVTSIGEGAFDTCTGLTSITIPASVTSIGDYAFYDCGNLTSVTIPENVTSIGFGAFKGCLSLTSVTIPGSVTNIGDDAFDACYSLTSVTIPSSVTYIGEEAFADCTRLTSVFFMGNAPIAEPSAFLDANYVTAYYLADTLGWTVFSRNTGVPAELWNPQRGTLQVTITPVAASLAGAQWEIDGGTWQKSGAAVTNVVVGTYTVRFNTVSGWTTPTNQSVSVSANAATKVNGNYVALGSLQVTITPAGAISAGAQWQVDGGTLQNSGTTVTNLSATNHTVSFSAIFGWTTPSNQAVSVKANSTAKATGTYEAEPGSLTVNLTPPAAVTNGAKWQVDGGKWQNSGATVTNLAPGVRNHRLTFNTISGWITPSNQTVSISNNLTTTASGTYVVQTGSLQVTLSPAAITNVAQWQADYGTWQNSGATVPNLPVGNHTVSFKGIDYWSGPANQTVLIKANSVAKVTGPYTFNAAGIYNGLFAQGDTKVETSGMLSGLTVTPSGTYTGKLLIGSSTNAVSGSFNFSGQAGNNVPRAAKQVGPLTMSMWVNWNNAPLNIGGTVSGTNGGAWTANLTAELASGGTNSAEYTALLSPAGPLPGYGYLLMTNHAGAVVLSGALADGTSFSQSVPVSGAGDLPVYGNLYGSTGLLIGWIGLESGSPAGNLTWIKEASHFSALYTNGFTNPVVALQGSVWTNPLPHTAAIDLPSGELIIAGGGLLSPLTFNVALSNNSTFVKLAGSATNSLTGTNNPKTGLLTITFGNGAGKSTTAGTGAVLQNAASGGGFFLGKTNAGSILLHP